MTKYAIMMNEAFDRINAKIVKFDSPEGYSFEEAKEELKQYCLDKINNMTEDNIE